MAGGAVLLRDIRAAAALALAGGRARCWQHASLGGCAVGDRRLRRRAGSGPLGWATGRSAAGARACLSRVADSVAAPSSSPPSSTLTARATSCLLYTSDAADEEDSVD